MQLATLLMLLLAAPEEGGDGLRRAVDEVLRDMRLPETIVTGRVDAAGVPEVPLDTPASRDVFGPDYVQRVGAREMNDLIRRLPGVSTRPYNGGEAAAPSFSIRGLPDDGLTEYLLVLIDGVPASGLPYGWTAFSFLPVTIDRVYAMDLLRGGYAVRYSPNTLGGVLNILTPPIPDEPTMETRVTYGTFDSIGALVRFGGQSGPWGLQGTFVDRRGDGYRKEGEFDQQEFSARILRDLAESGWLAVTLSSMSDEHKAPGGLTQAQFAADRFGNARERNEFDGERHLFDAVWHRDLDEESWLETYANVSMTRRRLRAQRPHFDLPATFLTWTDKSFFETLGVRATHRIHPAHVIHWGARAHHEHLPHYRIDSEPFPPGSGASTVTRDSAFRLFSMSAHVDDTWQVLETVKIVAGVRAEWVPVADGDDDVIGGSFDDRFFILLPGGDVSWQFHEHAALFANAHRSFRAPQVWGFDFTGAAQDLDFETGTSYEAGVRWRGIRGFSGSLAAWRIDVDDLGVFYSGIYENLGRIVAVGADLVLDWDAGEVFEGLRGLRLSFSWTVQDSELREGPNAGNQTPYAWKSKGAWNVSYETPDAWIFTLGGTFVGSSFSDEANTETENANGNLGRNSSVILWDARIGKRFLLGSKGEVELAVGATNLFDTDWEVHSRGGFFGPGLVAGPPRQLYASAFVSFRW